MANGVKHSKKVHKKGRKNLMQMLCAGSFPLGQGSRLPSVEYFHSDRGLTVYLLVRLTCSSSQSLLWAILLTKLGVFIDGHFRYPHVRGYY